MLPQYITIHSTGNPNSRPGMSGLANELSNTRTAWYIVVDEKEAVEAIPLTEVAWHAGDGSGQGNRDIESRFVRAETGENPLNAVQLAAKLLKEKAGAWTTPAAL